MSTEIAICGNFRLVVNTRQLTQKHLVSVQSMLEHDKPGYRNRPGTVLNDGARRIVYTPPQNPQDIVELMSDLERFLNDDARFDADPLIKMAIANHQFESIHPFYVGNGRTGRIMNVLYLVNKGLLDIPILSLSTHLLRTRWEYYRLLQSVRTSGDAAEEWQQWVLYMLTAVELTAEEAMSTVIAIRDARFRYKHRIRDSFKFYSTELVNNLFMHPYTRIEYLQRDLDVSRLTATKYLDLLAEAELLRKVKAGRNVYYVNVALNEILTRDSSRTP